MLSRAGRVGPVCPLDGEPPWGTGSSTKDVAGLGLHYQVEHCRRSVFLRFRTVSGGIHESSELFIGDSRGVHPERFEFNGMDRGFAVGWIAFVEAVAHLETPGRN